jgi:serine/threonine protein kinase
VNPARWRQINELFHAVLEQEGPARAEFLHRAAGGDIELVREVQSLLTSHERSEGFLDVPAWGVAPELMFDDSESLVGRQIGTYRITEEIGRGGMGVVYAAEDSRLGRPVAVKALTPEYTSDPVRRERLTREARAAACLSHPAIATIFALEEIDGELYIISELVRGRTLRHELADGPLPAERLLPTLVDIASALAAAHQHGIIHRDLKPENIVRRDDGQIKILDFGLARIDPAQNLSTFPRLTETGMALGTPGYMAPEQLSGGAVDRRSDIFAFGVVAWELATGEHPFGADPAALLARMTELMEGRAARLSRPMPIAGLDPIVRRCLRAAPSERYPSADALLEELRALLGTSAWASGAGLPQDARQQSRSHTPLWWWQFHQAAAAVVHGSMPIAAWLIRRSIEPRPVGTSLFFATLALATISVTLRLNLWFTSRVHPDALVEHRTRLFPSIMVADGLLAGVFLTIAFTLMDLREEVAVLFVIVAVASLASLFLIEPATTRGAGLTKDSGP